MVTALIKSLSILTKPIRGKKKNNTRYPGLNSVVSQHALVILLYFHPHKTCHLLLTLMLFQIQTA